VRRFHCTVQQATLVESGDQIVIAHKPRVARDCGNRVESSPPDTRRPHVDKKRAARSDPPAKPVACVNQGLLGISACNAGSQASAVGAGSPPTRGEPRLVGRHEQVPAGSPLAAGVASLIASNVREWSYQAPFDGNSRKELIILAAGVWPCRAVYDPCAVAPRATHAARPRWSTALFTAGLSGPKNRATA